MKTFGHILFPVDFSDRAVAARPSVESWAQRFKAKVSLLHIIQIPISAYGGPDGYPLTVDVRGIEASATNRLDRFEFASAERIVKIGDPTYEIARYAESSGVDLIMMPTHGYGPFRSMLLGSVAAKVLHDAHCAVWTCAHHEVLPVHSEIRNILCAIEDKDALPLVQSAGELAQQFGATLRLVHAVPVDETWPEKYLETDFNAGLFKASREKIAAFQEDAGTSYEVHLHPGNVSKVVRDAALADQADLVIIGAGKIHEALGRLRSNAYAIIRDSPAPVLSLP